MTIIDGHEVDTPIPFIPTTISDPIELDAGYTALRLGSDAHVVTFPETPSEDLTDLPLAALADIADCAMHDAGVLVDNLATLRQQNPSSPETYAYDIHVRRAYLDAEASAQQAWQALATALQLIKGLAR